MPAPKWNKENLRKVAAECTTKGELRKKYPGVRKAAKNLGIWEEITAHMPETINKGRIPHNKKWNSIEDILPFSSQCKTRTEFYKKFPKAYQGAKDLGILDIACAHMPKDASVGKTPHNKKWNLENAMQEALKYNTRGKFKQKASAAYDFLNKIGKLDEACKHIKVSILKGASHPNFKWANETLRQEALKYRARGEFKEKSPNAYGVALERKILDEIAPHMPKYVNGETHPKFKWTNEKIREEASKYNTRTEFQQNCGSAYVIAIQNNILEAVCSHMKLSTNISIAERNLFDIIKLTYPKVQKLRVRSKRNKSLIENKPHIQGFDIDIYIPELRKGIEFDGDYWHSIEGLKRSREHWPEEDLKNYSDIKRTYFKSKEIEILHIKEADWKKDKQDCINKCLQFLGV